APRRRRPRLVLAGERLLLGTGAGPFLLPFVFVPFLLGGGHRARSRALLGILQVRERLPFLDRGLELFGLEQVFRWGRPRGRPLGGGAFAVGPARHPAPL